MGAGGDEAAALAGAQAPAGFLAGDADSQTAKSSAQADLDGPVAEEDKLGRINLKLVHQLFQ